MNTRITRGSIIGALLVCLIATGPVSAKEKKQEKRKQSETVQQCINKVYARYQISLKSAMKSRKTALKKSVDTFSLARKHAMVKKDREALKVSLEILRDNRKTALVVYANAQKKAVQMRKESVVTCKNIQSN